MRLGFKLISLVFLAIGILSVSKLVNFFSKAGTQHNRNVVDFSIETEIAIIYGSLLGSIGLFIGLYALKGFQPRNLFDWVLVLGLGIFAICCFVAFSVVI